jgi:diguanylate cyclase
MTSARRTGDDEFALLIPAIATLTDSAALAGEGPSAMPMALRRARELAEHLGRPIEVAGVRLAVEVAIGVTVAEASRADLGELIRRASLALGQAKQLEVAVAPYATGQDTVSTDELALLAELQDALAADDQIVLQLQPAVDLINAAPTGVEALVRWRHPRRGQLSPNDFIRTVEHTELLTPFTRRVLDLALSAASSWHAAGVDVPVSVNVSARSLLDPGFPAQVDDTARRRPGWSWRSPSRWRSARRRSSMTSWPSSATPACSSPWTTSAPATHHWRSSPGPRSTRSKSTAPSSTT